MREFEAQMFKAKVKQPTEEPKRGPGGQALIAALDEGREIPVIGGAFCDQGRGCNGFVEAIERPEEGGTFIKFYGTRQKLKLFYPNKEHLHRLEVPKWLLFQAPARFIKTFYLALPFLALHFLFFRKRTMDFITDTLLSLSWKTCFEIENGERDFLPKEQFCAFVRALPGMGPKNRWLEPMTYGMEFLRFFLEMDLTYRFPVQDAWNRDFEGFFQTIIQRTTVPKVKEKWQFLYRVLKALRWADRDFREALDALFATKAPPLDNDDRFFCYQNKSYDYDGLTHEERMDVWNMMNQGNEYLRA